LDPSTHLPCAFPDPTYRDLLNKGTRTPFNAHPSTQQGSTPYGAHRTSSRTADCRHCGRNPQRQTWNM